MKELSPSGFHPTFIRKLTALLLAAIVAVAVAGTAAPSTSLAAESELAAGSTRFHELQADSGALSLQATSQAQTLIDIAQSQVGSTHSKYTKWFYGKEVPYVAWCHIFVSWCAEQAGAASIIPHTALCLAGVDWFKEQGRWHDVGSGYQPKPGDIVYFLTDKSSLVAHHVGIVKGVDTTYIYVVEGNSGYSLNYKQGVVMGTNKYRRDGKAIGDSTTRVLGYGSPAYAAGHDFTCAIETPSNGQAISGNLTVTGWAQRDGVAPSRVVCQLNGASQYEATRYNRSGFPANSGFRVEVPSSALSSGANWVSLWAYFPDGSKEPIGIRDFVKGASSAGTSSAAGKMFRLYNPNSGEHFYTITASERDNLVKVGWDYEGIGWNAPQSSKSPVYRMYNPNSGDHHYTLSVNERDQLWKIGWNFEGVGWYSDDAKSVPLYRQYNPNAVTGTHNYTTSKAENDELVRLGWKAEGIGWYGVKAA